jgi:hypothetical protein
MIIAQKGNSVRAWFAARGIGLAGQDATLRPDVFRPRCRLEEYRDNA